MMNQNICKIWYLNSRTVSDDEIHCDDMMIARSALPPSSPRLRRSVMCGIGLGRSARPSKSGDCSVPRLRTTSDSAGFLKFALIFGGYAEWPGDDFDDAWLADDP